MARNPKVKRKWLKDEKRIVLLMYRKGLLKEWKIDELYWAEYKWLKNKCFRVNFKQYDNSSKRGKLPVYMPEIHFWVSDYWGEGDEKGLVDRVIDNLFWENADIDNWDDTDGSYPVSTFNVKTRKGLITYLNSLLTVVNDHKINRILHTQKEKF